MGRMLAAASHLGALVVLTWGGTVLPGRRHHAAGLPHRASIRIDSLHARPDDVGRRIDAAAPGYMWRHAAGYAEAPQDTAGLKRLLTHHGIEDGSGRCSTIYFWGGRRWRELPGAD